MHWNASSNNTGSGSLQEKRGHLDSTDHDIIFATWAFADRLHAVAAECEWAITQLWTDVCMRAALEVSPGALQRVARSLRVWRDAALEQVQKIRTVVADQQYRRDGEYAVYQVRCVRASCQREVASASAVVMMQWRMC